MKGIRNHRTRRNTLDHDRRHGRTDHRAVVWLAPRDEVGAEQKNQRAL